MPKNWLHFSFFHGISTFNFYTLCLEVVKKSKPKEEISLKNLAKRLNLPVYLELLLTASDTSFDKLFNYIKVCFILYFLLSLFFLFYLSISVSVPVHLSLFFSMSVRLFVFSLSYFLFFYFFLVIIILCFILFLSVSFSFSLSNTSLSLFVCLHSLLSHTHILIFTLLVFSFSLCLSYCL